MERPGYNQREQHLSEIDGIIDVIIERVYNNFASRFETDSSTVHRDRYCGYIVPDFKTRLDASGFETLHRIWKDASGRVHHYLETLDGIIIDPTWQQFLDPDTSSRGLPRVLIVHRDDLENKLTDLNVPQRRFGIWLDTQNDEVDSDNDDWGWSDRRDSDDNDAGWSRWGWKDGNDDPLPDEEPKPYQRPAAPYEGQSRPSVSVRSLGTTIDGGIEVLETEVRPSLIMGLQQYELAAESLHSTLRECRGRIAELSRIGHDSGPSAVTEAQAEIKQVSALQATIENYLDEIERQRGHVEIAHYAIGRAAEDMQSYQQAIGLAGKNYGR